MPLAINDLKIVHSGGATNESPTADLGGAISTAANKVVQSQLAASTGITGVTILESFGNPEGSGNLLYTAANTFLSWRPFGGSTYFGVDVSVNGTYLIGSSAGYLVVSVTSASLPGVDALVSVTITNNQSNVFVPVSAGDSLAGSVHYRCLYVLNTSAGFTANDVRLWIAENTPAGDTIDIGLDPAGLNGVATTIVDEDTAPAGVTFSAPLSYASGLAMGNIPIDGFYAFWQRRTVPPETRGTVISNGAVLAIGAVV